MALLVLRSTKGPNSWFLTRPRKQFLQKLGRSPQLPRADSHDEDENYSYDDTDDDEG